MKLPYVDKVRSFLIGEEGSDTVWQYHVFFLLFGILFIGISIHFQFLSHYINGMDTSQWLNFDVFMKKSLSIWNSDASGKIEPMAFTPFFYNVLLKGIQIIFRQLILSINIYWIGFLYFLQVTYFYFYRIFLGNRKAFIAVLFTFLSMKMISSLEFPVPYVDIALAAVPLMFFFLHSYVFKKKFIYAALYIVFQVVLFRVLNVLLLANIVVPLVLFFACKDQIPDVKGFLKKVIAVWVISFMACFMLTINFGISYIDLSHNQSIAQYNDTSLTPFYMNRFSVLNIFKLTDHFSLADDKPEFPGFIYFKFGKLYTQNWFYVLISFIFFGLFVGNLLENRKERKVLAFAAAALILIFFAKSLNPPWESINRLLYSNAIYTTFFRSGSKYFMYLIVPLVTLAIFAGAKKHKLFYPLVWLSILVHAFLIFVYATPISKYWNTVLPPQYLEVTKELESLSDNDKILVLPISPRATGELVFQDGYAGLSRMQLLSSKSFVTKTEAVRGSSEYNSLFNSLANEMDVKQDMIDANADTLDYRYILIQKDAKYYYDLKIESGVHTPEDIETNLNPAMWHKVFDNADFALYQVNPEFFGGKLRVSLPAGSSFSSISDTKYRISVDHLGSPSELSFLEAFQPGWKLYLEPREEDQECVSPDYFPLTETTECQSPKQTISFADIGFLFRKPVFDSSHAIVLTYANKWVLDPEFIKQHFDPTLYQENPDGSINISLTLYFKPQAYFNSSLLVSGATVVVSLSYGIYELIGRRKKRKPDTILNETEN